jgi:hypothetical protein
VLAEAEALLGSHQIRQEAQVLAAVALVVNGTIKLQLCRQQMLEVQILAAVAVVLVQAVQA